MLKTSLCSEDKEMEAHLDSAGSKQTPRIHTTILEVALPVSPFTHSFPFFISWSLQRTGKLPRLFSAMGAEASKFEIHSTVQMGQQLWNGKRFPQGTR